MHFDVQHTCPAEQLASLEKQHVPPPPPLGVGAGAGVGDGGVGAGGVGVGPVGAVQLLRL